MAKNIIKNYEHEKREIERLANAGYFIGLFTFYRPKYMDITYDPRWQYEYNVRNYQFIDPVVRWCFNNTGKIRHSEIRYSGLKFIMERSQKYGISYGCVFSTKMYGSKHFFTAARSDREFEDFEIDSLHDRWVSILENLEHVIDLSDEDFAILQLLFEGVPVKDLPEHLQIKMGIKHSLSSINRRIDRMKNAMNAANTIQLVGKAVARGYIGETYNN